MLVYLVKTQLLFKRTVIRDVHSRTPTMPLQQLTNIVDGRVSRSLNLQMFQFWKVLERFLINVGDLVFVQVPAIGLISKSSHSC